MKRLSTVFLFLCLILSVHAQILEPITWSFSSRDISANEKDLLFKASIDQGWHLYGLDLPEGGPIATTFTFSEIKGAKLIGKIKAERMPVFEFDKQFDMQLNWFDTDVTFVQRIELTQKKFSIAGELRFMGCNDETCLPPTPEEFSFSGQRGMAVKEEKAEESPADTNQTSSDSTIALIPLQPALPAQPSTPENVASNDLWAPVTAELQAFGKSTVTQ
ncbi:MAG: protein-disulfide reductase DsbD domain-containing protein, partial [Bacteroidales bacterium]